MGRIILIIYLMIFTGCASADLPLKEIKMTATRDNEILDMTGKTISPYILYHTALRLKSANTGEIVKVRCDIFKAVENDIKAFCRMAGHTFTDIQTDGQTQIFHIEKGSPTEKNKSLAMIISDPGLEKLLSPLGIALSAAICGRRVHLYFQGPATRLLKKGYTATLEGMSKPFSAFARNALARAGHLPAEEKIVQIKEMGGTFYICGGSMEHFGVNEKDLIFDDIIQAEYFTILEVMESADVQIVLQ